MSDELKLHLFIITVKSILLYGCKAWTLNTEQEARLAGYYTRILQVIMNVTCRDFIMKSILYGNLPKFLSNIRTQRLKLAGQCIRDEDLPANSLVLWELKHCWASRGGQFLKYIDQLE